MAGSCSLPLLFHFFLKTRHIYGKAGFCHDFPGQLNREAIGIIKPENGFA